MWLGLLVIIVSVVVVNLIDPNLTSDYEFLQVPTLTVPAP